jgi:hypothetical protein
MAPTELSGQQQVDAAILHLLAGLCRLLVERQLIPATSVQQLLALLQDQARRSGYTASSNAFELFRASMQFETPLPSAEIHPFPPSDD